MRKRGMKNKIAALVLAFTLGVLGTKAYAGFYHYTDSNGSVHCVDNISNVPEQYRDQLKDAESLSGVSVVGIPGPSRDEALSAKTPQAVDRPTKKTVQYSGTVDVFVTSWCGYCKKLEKFLDSNGIHYTTFDIEKDDNAHKQYKELGGRGVPLARIGSSVVRGYNPDAVLKAIEHER
jgi:glutaredoxin